VSRNWLKDTWRSCALQRIGRVLALLCALLQLQLAAYAQWNSENYDLSSTERTARSTDPLTQPVNVNVGAKVRTVTPTSMLTAAEAVAVNQILATGQQSLLLSRNGAAIGGQLNLTRDLSAQVQNLVVPQGVTALGDFSTISNLNLAGNLSNSGNIYAYSNSANSSATFAANNILNGRNGLMSTVLPRSLANALGTPRESVDLSLIAKDSIVNHGLIESSGALNLAANNIVNSSVRANTASLQAATGVNLLSPSITNSGSITTLAGNINVTSATAANLNFNNTGGTLSALAGNINFRDPTFTAKFDVSIKGGDFNSNELNFYSGYGSVTGLVDNVTSTTNIYAGSANLGAAGDSLTLGTLTLSEDPIFYNLSGDLILSGDITTNGNFLALIASRNVIHTSGKIDTSSAMSGGRLIVVAGWKESATNPIPQQGNNVSTLTMLPVGGSTTGGKIDFTGTTLISTEGKCSNCGGGAITMIAYAGTADKSGTIKVPCPINANGTIAGGIIQIYAGASSGDSIVLNDISNTGSHTMTSSAITIAASQPSVGGRLVAQGGGLSLSPSFNGFLITNGNIRYGNIRTFGGAVTIATNGTKSGGTIITLASTPAPNGNDNGSGGVSGSENEPAPLIIRADLMTSLDLTDPLVVASLLQLQQEQPSLIGGTLLVTNGIAIGGNLILTSTTDLSQLTAQHIPEGVTLTLEGFDLENPININLANEPYSAVTIKGTQEFIDTGMAVINITGSAATSALTIYDNGKLLSDGNLSINISGGFTTNGTIAVSNGSLAIATMAGSRGQINHYRGNISASESISLSADGATNIRGTLSSDTITVHGNDGLFVAGNIVASGETGSISLTTGLLRYLTLEGEGLIASTINITTSLILQKKGEAISSNTLNLKIQGDVGTPSAPLLIDANELRVNSAAGVWLQSRNPGLTIHESSSAGFFDVKVPGTIQVKGEIKAGTISLAATSNNGSIIIDSPMGRYSDGSISLTANGLGSIIGGPNAALNNPIVILSVDQGTIGTEEKPFKTLAYTLVLHSNSTVYIDNTIPTHPNIRPIGIDTLTVLESSVQGDLALHSNGNIDIAGSITSIGKVTISADASLIVSGPIKAGAALFLFSGYDVNSTIQIGPAANLFSQGPITIQNMDTNSGLISFGSGAQIIAKGQIAILIGELQGDPERGAAPSTISAHEFNDGKVFFGKIGILGELPQNSITADGNNIIFNIASSSLTSSAIRLGGKVVINSHQGSITLINLDLTNPDVANHLIAAQQNGILGGTLVTAQGAISGGTVILRPEDLANSLAALVIPKGVQVTFEGFQTENPIIVEISAESTTKQVVINGQSLFTGDISPNAILAINSDQKGPVITLGRSGLIDTTGTLVLSANGNMALGGIMTGEIGLFTTANNGSIALNGNIGSDSKPVTINLHGTGSLTQSGNGGIVGSTLTLLADTGNIGSAKMGTKTQVDNVQATTGGIVNLANSKVINILDSKAASFIVSAVGGLTAANIETTSGPITLISKGGDLHINADAKLESTRGTITLQNRDQNLGTISIGENATIYASIVSAKERLNISIGNPPVLPIAGSAPGNTVTTSGAGKVYFGKNGITSVNNQFNALGNSIVFSTGRRSASAITLEQGISITASTLNVGFADNSDLEMDACMTQQPIIDTGDICDDEPDDETIANK
jgi:hypothetical protein